MQSTRRRHDQSTDECAEYDADYQDDDRCDNARDVAHQLREHVGERLKPQRVRGDQHHREHHEPEDETPSDSRWIHSRARSLDSLHHAATLEDLIEVDPSHQPIGSLLEQSGEEITGKQNDQRAEQRRYVAIELLEAILQSLAESERRRGIH